MKKFLTYVLLVAMVLTLITGCASNTSEDTGANDAAPAGSTTEEAQQTGETQVVRVQLIGNFLEEDSLDPLTGETIKGVNVMEESFEAQNPNIDIEFILMGWDDYNTKTQAMIMAGEADVVQVPGVASMASMDILEPLAPYIERDGFDLDAYIPGQVEGWQVMGPNDTELTTYALPWIADTRFIIYDKEIFDQWGVEYLSAEPTIDEVTSKIAQMTGTNPVTGIENFGMYYNGKDVQDVAMNIAEGLGGTWGSGSKFDELQFNFNSAELVEAGNILQDINQYAPEGYMSGSGGEKFRYEDNNIAILLRGSPGYVADITTLGLLDKYGIARLFVNEELNMGGLFAGSPFAIANNSEVKDAAWEFLKFSQSVEWQEFMWTNYDCLPTIQEGSSFAGIEDNELYSQVVDTIQYLWAPRYPYDSTSTRGILKTGFESIVTGADAQEILDVVQADSEQWVSEQ